MIILASNSPRRKELLGGLDMEFRTWVIPGIDESYPRTMKAEIVPEYIAQKKTIPYFNDVNIGEINDEDIVLTADTVVILNGEVLGKPKDEKEACLMLRKLSGKTHHVITGVCLRTKTKMRHFSVKTDVTFANLTDEQIEYYVSNYHPLDKAGSYGVQEWIGYVGVTKLEGSYFNVMGLPVQRIYEELKVF
ncbi:septum formation protein Maf [Prevotella sp. PINT]|jgi:MAF protein|uniref:Maf family nucleotide pyrophosphatase n=1 Tax=Palleniella intestinalis TaxID=2736291 RepID=UPI0015541EF7|nr:Maf family nucleotide pyrophosphatase [Palleniella intestinalis]NPD80446.1 septum formation protein Maf [Palleniella intestinalis]